MNELLLVFSGLTIINVIIQTTKSLVMIKCNKWISSLVCMIAYWINTVMTVYLLCDLNLFTKANIVAVCNLVGTFIVKLVEEKLRKDRLWKIEATFSGTLNSKVFTDFKESTGIPLNFIDVDKYFIVNFYSSTSKQTSQIKSFIEYLDGKYFISESRGSGS